MALDSRDDLNEAHALIAETLASGGPVEDELDAATAVLDALLENGWQVLRDQPDHFVTFDEDGWFIEHSIACRVAGTIGTCDFNLSIRSVYDADGEDVGRWRITHIDSSGMPSLERTVPARPHEEGGEHAD